jgi:hypothetical protein
MSEMPRIRAHWADVPPPIIDSEPTKLTAIPISAQPDDASRQYPNLSAFVPPTQREGLPIPRHDKARQQTTPVWQTALELWRGLNLDVARGLCCISDGLYVES